MVVYVCVVVVAAAAAAVTDDVRSRSMSVKNVCNVQEEILYVYLDHSATLLRHTHRGIMVSRNTMHNLDSRRFDESRKEKIESFRLNFAGRLQISAI